MECGDSSPLWTGQFIGPPGTACDGGGGEINFAVKSGPEVPHSISVISAGKWYQWELLKIDFNREKTRKSAKENTASFASFRDFSG
jgi:hypothetical protein